MDNPIFKWNVFFLRMTAIYKTRKGWSRVQKMAYYVWRIVWILSLYGGIALNVLDIMSRGEDDNKISDIAINVMNLELYISITIRASYFAMDNSDIDYLANQMANHFRFQTRFARKTKTVDWHKTAAKYLLWSWMAFVTVASTLMVLGVLVKSPRTLPIQIWTFYDWRATEYYFLTLIIEWISLTLTLLTFGNMDMLNATFMLLISGEVEMLAADFENIFVDALIKQGCSEYEVLEYVRYANENRSESFGKLNNLVNTSEFKKDLMDNFVFCIKEHQKLLKYIDEYQDYISPYLLVEVNFIFGYMIFMLFVFVITDNKSLYIPLFQYISGATGQIFVATYLGERLITAIENVRQALYSVPWYSCDRNFLKNFKFVQLRMSKPVVITVGKLLTMTLDTFLEFMRRAFSFFTVLRQYNNQQK